MCVQKKEKTMKIGRPPLDNPKLERIFIRVTKEQKDRLQQMATERGQTVSELLLKSVGLIK